MENKEAADGRIHHINMVVIVIATSIWIWVVSIDSLSTTAWSDQPDLRLCKTIEGGS
jgi:hypothetical protein